MAGLSTAKLAICGLVPWRKQAASKQASTSKAAPTELAGKSFPRFVSRGPGLPANEVQPPEAPAENPRAIGASPYPSTPCYLRTSSVVRGLARDIWESSDGGEETWHSIVPASSPRRCLLFFCKGEGATRAAPFRNTSERRPLRPFPPSWAHLQPAGLDRPTARCRRIQVAQPYDLTPRIRGLPTWTGPPINFDPICSRMATE